MAKTKWTGAKRIWFVMDCGSEIGDAAKYNRSRAEQKQLHYMGTAQIIMPENYIAMFNAPQVDEAQQITAKAEPDIQAAITFHPIACIHLLDYFQLHPVIIYCQYSHS